MPSLEQVYKNICDDLIRILTNDLVRYIKELMQEKIDEEVYDKYDPDSYMRRYDNGGLHDINNIKHELEFTNNGVIIKVFDDAKTDDGADYLDKYIIEGDKYTWENSRIYNQMPFERNYIDATMQSLIGNKQVQKIIKDALNRKGLKVI